MVLDLILVRLGPYTRDLVGAQFVGRSANSGPRLARFARPSPAAPLGPHVS